MPKLSVASLAAAMALWGCSSRPTASLCTDELNVRPVPGDTTLSVGQQFTAHVLLSTCGGTRQVNDTFTWTSQDSAVARVDRLTGVATAVAPGRTSLMATSATYGALGGSSITVR
jgi:hypothetical protein